MEDPAKMELQQWVNFDQTYLKDFLRDSSSMKLTDIIAERDTAISECGKAIAEKKNANAERDAALLQRDVAYADRNAAWTERDSALKALRIMHADENDPENDLKVQEMVQFVADHSSIGLSYLCLPNSVSETAKINMLTDTDHIETRLPQKQTKQQQATNIENVGSKRQNIVDDKKASKPSVRKRKEEDIVQDVASSMKKYNLQDPSRSSGSPYDLSTSVPVPICSCTGNIQKCYRWGNGGWQSACCTKFISQYPLPMSEVKSGARVPGRKMSGRAFRKLLEKLAGIGVDITKPIDLKNHWAKHGTNRYVTIR